MGGEGDASDQVQVVLFNLASRGSRCWKKKKLAKLLKMFRRLDSECRCPCVPGVGEVEWRWWLTNICWISSKTLTWILKLSPLFGMIFSSHDAGAYVTHSNTVETRVRTRLSLHFRYLFYHNFDSKHVLYDRPFPKTHWILKQLLQVMKVHSEGICLNVDCLGCGAGWHWTCIQVCMLPEALSSLQKLFQ